MTTNQWSKEVVNNFKKGVRTTAMMAAEGTPKEKLVEVYVERVLAALQEIMTEEEILNTETDFIKTGVLNRTVFETSVQIATEIFAD